MSINPPKALIALVALICMTVLLGLGKVDTSEGLPVVTMIVGYVVGNGVGARQNLPIEPIIKKKEPK